MLNRKVIYIINQYGSTPINGYAGRTYYFSKELALMGYDVYYITANFSHLLRQEIKMDGNMSSFDTDGFTHIALKVLGYKGSSSIKRILNWFLFSRRVKKLVSASFPRPDIIIYSSPSIVGFKSAYELSRKFDCNIILDVRDLWPLTFKLLGNFSSYNPFIFLLSLYERFAYEKANLVISNLKGVKSYIEKLIGKSVSFHWIPNGIDVSEVSAPYTLPDGFFPEGIAKKFVIGYAGSIGIANSLTQFIEAAKLLEHHSQIAFVVVGDGAQLSSMQDLVKQLDLANVFFLPPVFKNQVQNVLKCFDVCFIGWNDEQLYEFGIGANKIPEYFFSGKPVLHAYSGAYDPVADFSAGLTVKAQRPDLIASQVLKLYDMAQIDRESFGKNGYNAAVSCYDYHMISKKLNDIIQALLT